MHPRITLCAAVFGLVGCGTPGFSNAPTDTLVVRTAQHEVRVEQGQCLAVNPHTCTPEDGYGLPRALVVSFRPLSPPGAACARISDVAAWEANPRAASTRPLSADYSRGPADGCALTTCFVVGDAGPAGAVREVVLSWRTNGQPEPVTQTMVLTPTAGGQFALQLKGGALALRGSAVVR